MTSTPGIPSKTPQHDSSSLSDRSKPTGLRALYAKVTSCGQSAIKAATKFFTKTSIQSADMAMKTHRVAPLENEQENNASSRPTSPSLSENSEGPAVDLAPSSETPTPSTPTAKKSDEPKPLEGKIQSINTAFTFTMKVNGKEMTLTPKMMQHLQPILDTLAATPEGKSKLAQGFTLLINLDDFSDIHVYQGSHEILTNVFKDFFTKNQNLLTNMQEFKNMLEEERKRLAAGLNEAENKIPEVEVEANPAAESDLPSYMKRIKGDGDCLLAAALEHIKRIKPSSYDRLTVDELRKAIANSIEKEHIDLIMQDIRTELEVAKKKGKLNAPPYDKLNIPQIMDRINDDKDPPANDHEAIIGAYRNYILDDRLNMKSYLGRYAISYLNNTYFRENPLLIVTADQALSNIAQEDKNVFKHHPTYFNGDFNNRNPLTLDMRDRSKIPVVFYDGGHYTYVDSSKEEFWAAYTRSSPEEVD